MGFIFGAWCLAFRVWGLGITILGRCTTTLDVKFVVEYVSQTVGWNPKTAKVQEGLEIVGPEGHPHVTIPTYKYMCIYIYLSLSLSLPTYLPTYLPTQLSIDLSIYLSTYLSIWCLPELGVPYLGSP